jgi:hypothetical protein
MTFDLNIDNYTRDELIEMFELPSNFDKRAIEMKEAKLIENIMNNREINNDTKSKTINFLRKAKTIILNEFISPFVSDIEKKVEPYITNLEEKGKAIFRALGGSNELSKTRLQDSSEHMIQLRPPELYAPSHPVEFIPGVINPLKKRFARKSLNIDSRFRDNYYTTSSTNFNVNLPLNIDNVVQMQLTNIELPTTFYAVSKQYGNNFFTITVVLNDSSISTTVINIPTGNYGQSDIMDIINRQLTLAGTPFSYVAFIVNLTGFSTGSGQTMVGPNLDVSGSNTVSYIELNFQTDRNGLEDRNTPLPLKFGWILGFRNGFYTGNLNYVSEGLVDLSGPRYLYLVVDDYNNNVNNNFFSAFNSSILNKNILARISLLAMYFNILNQNTVSFLETPREYFGPINLQTMNIQLLDEYGRIVDLNNMDFSFCLSLSTIYDL